MYDHPEMQRMADELAELRAIVKQVPARFDASGRFVGAGYPTSNRTAGGMDFGNVDALGLLRTCNAIVTMPSTPTVAVGRDSDPIPLEFREMGKYNAGNCKSIHIIGIRGTVVDSTAGSESAGAYELSTMLVNIQNARGTNLITNGQGGTFTSFQELFAGTLQFFPCAIDIPPAEIFNVTYRNDQPATGHSLKPRLTWFLRIEEK